MSASPAGKFQDQYAVLGLDPKSDSETIQRAYSKLAQKYHPNNPETANKEKFEAVNMAYEVLCDPLLRREFDKLKGIGQEEGTPRFSGFAFFEALGREAVLRNALLCILYDRRMSKPFTPSLSLRHVEGMLEATSEELSSALWYLKQRGYAASDDKSKLLITVDGMDFLENSKPDPQAIMRLIRTENGKSPEPAKAPEPIKAPEPVKASEHPRPPASGAVSESVRNLLNRTLART